MHRKHQLANQCARSKPSKIQEVEFEGHVFFNRLPLHFGTTDNGSLVVVSYRLSYHLASSRLVSSRLLSARLISSRLVSLWTKQLFFLLFPFLLFPPPASQPANQRANGLNLDLDFGHDNSPLFGLGWPLTVPARDLVYKSLFTRCSKRYSLRVWFGTL